MQVNKAYPGGATIKFISTNGFRLASCTLTLFNKTLFRLSLSSTRIPVLNTNDLSTVSMGSVIQTLSLKEISWLKLTGASTEDSTNNASTLAILHAPFERYGIQQQLDSPCFEIMSPSVTPNHPLVFYKAFGQNVWLKLIHSP